MVFRFITFMAGITFIIFITFMGDKILDNTFLIVAVITFEIILASKLIEK